MNGSLSRACASSRHARRHGGLHLHRRCLHFRSWNQRKYQEKLPTFSPCHFWTAALSAALYHTLFEEDTEATSSDGARKNAGGYPSFHPEQVLTRWTGQLNSFEQSWRIQTGSGDCFKNFQLFPNVYADTAEDAAKTFDFVASFESRIAALKSELVEEQLSYQQKIFKMEKENQDLRRQIMARQDGRDNVKLKKIKRNPIEAYSEILDELMDLQRSFGSKLTLPQIVIVGDSGSGKRSLLERLFQTRIFPRGEAPISVPIRFTLCEGPYHLAQFGDTDREFDLENVDEVVSLRKEIEVRMKAASSSSTSQPIKLTVWGRGLPRMVVNYVPSLSTNGSSKQISVPEWAKEYALSLMQSPQTLILCLIDGSQDSNYSKTVESVKDMDPDGRRTMYLLTKADLAESSLDDNKATRIVDGSIFPLKAIGYYTAVCGKGHKDEPLEDVQKAEEDFFATSKIFQSGVLKRENMSIKKLGEGLSQAFWRFVRNALRPQIDMLKVRKSQLEKEWKSKYQKARVLDRDELYESGRMQLLDDVVRLTSITGNLWETELEEMLWTSMMDYIFDNIYVPVASNHKTDSKLAGEIRLKNWADNVLPSRCLEIAANVLHKQFTSIALQTKENGDDIYNNFKQTVVDETFKLHKWDSKAREALRNSLLHQCDTPYIITPDDWNISVRFMEQACADRLAKIQEEFSRLLGPSTLSKWFMFKKQTAEHRNRRAVVGALEKFIAPPGEDLNHGIDLSKDEANVVIRTLDSQGTKVDPNFVRETWRYMFLRRFLEHTMNGIALCADMTEMDDLNNRQLMKGACGDVELFHRIKLLLRSASVSLRQQIMSTEIVRLEGEVRQILDGLERNPGKIKEYFNHPRIELAEELKKITVIQENLEDLMRLIEDEEPSYRKSDFSGDDIS